MSIILAIPGASVTARNTTRSARMRCMHASSLPLTRPASATPPAFVWPVRVYYEDTDAAGVVYYANYLRFCERARTEWLRSLGFEQQSMLEEAHTGFVVSSVQAHYRRPARLNDQLQVISTVAEMRGASLLFAQNILRNEELIFESRICIACIDTLRNRPVALPPALRAQLLTPDPS